MQPAPTLAQFDDAARRRFNLLRRYSLLATLPLVLFGCRQPKVTAYQTAKESAANLPASAPAHADAAAPADAAMPAPDSSPAAPSTMPAAPASAHDALGLQTAAGAGLTWVAPAAWQAKPAGGMRKASFTVPGDGGATADLAVTAFPGDVGGEIANVIRWRGQVGLPPVSDADAVASILRIETNGLKIGVVDVADASTPNGPRLLGAMVPFEGATWFFKLTGADAVVAKAKPAFLEFLKSVKPANAKP